MSSNASDSGISRYAGSTTNFSTSGLSLRTDRSKSPLLFFKDEPISTSNTSDSGISISARSTTNFSTSGLSLRTDRSKSPLLFFKEEPISTRQRVSAWLNHKEIRRPELLDTEDKWSRLPVARVQHGIGHANGGANDNSNWQRFVQTMSVVGAAGLVLLMVLFRL